MCRGCHILLSAASESPAPDVSKGDACTSLAPLKVDCGGRLSGTQTLRAPRASHTSTDTRNAECVCLVFFQTFWSVSCSPTSVGMKADCLPEHMHRSHLQRQECKCDSGGLITTRPVRVGERVIHEIYNWLHNIALTFSVFLFPGDQAVIANEIVWFAVAVFTHTVFPFPPCAAGCWSTPSTCRTSAFRR